MNILALAVYLRFTHAISYRRLTQLFRHLYALQISEGALDAMLQCAKPCFDHQVATILARLRRSRIVCSDETTVRIDGRTNWNWVFQNDQVVIHVVRNQPRRQRGHRDDGRSPAEHLDLRPLRFAAGACRMSDSFGNKPAAMGVTKGTRQVPGCGAGSSSPTSSPMIRLSRTTHVRRVC